MADKATQTGRRRTDELAPETENAEQDRDADDQAQTIAQEARQGGMRRAADSDKVNPGDPGDDVQDTAEHMKQMERSGRIDMSAYDGEPNHDDNVDKYGKRNKLDGLRGDGT